MTVTFLRNFVFIKKAKGYSNKGRIFNAGNLLKSEDFKLALLRIDLGVPRAGLNKNTKSLLTETQTPHCLPLSNVSHKPRASKLLQMSKCVWIKRKKICVKQNKSVKPHGGNVLVWGMMWR